MASGTEARARGYETRTCCETFEENTPSKALVQMIQRLEAYSLHAQELLQQLQLVLRGDIRMMKHQQGLQYLMDSLKAIEYNELLYAIVMQTITTGYCRMKMNCF